MLFSGKFACKQLVTIYYSLWHSIYAAMPFDFILWSHLLACTQFYNTHVFLRPSWTKVGVKWPRSWCSFPANLLVSNWLLYTIHCGIVYMLPCSSISFFDPNYGRALSFSTPTCSLDPLEQKLGSSVLVAAALLRQFARKQLVTIYYSLWYIIYAAMPFHFIFWPK